MTAPLPDPHPLYPLLDSLSQRQHPVLLQRNRALAADGRHYRPAAVLLGIVPIDGSWHILLTRRSERLREHSGQIALPGGRRDDGDPCLTATALRETAEETGIDAGYWHTFPALPPLYTPSGYAVHAVPALGTHPVSPLAQPAEVAEIFYLPLTLARRADAYHWQSFSHNGTNTATPALDYRHYHIWGATACILYSLTTHDLCETAGF